MLLTLLGLALFLALAFWQLDRARQKDRLFAAYAGAIDRKPVTLAAARSEDLSTHFPRVEVEGRYDAAHAYELVDQAREGRVGSISYVPFDPADGSTPVLVDRGFIAGDARGEPPKIPPPPDGETRIDALYLPAPGRGLELGGNPLPRQQTWPKQSIFLDIGDIEKDLGHPLDANVLMLAPENGSPFLREWKPNVFPPARHRGYAFTWFMLAAATIALFFVVNRRKESR